MLRTIDNLHRMFESVAHAAAVNPGIERFGGGDPTAIGWLTTVAYFMGAWACFQAFRTSAASLLSGGCEQFWLAGTGLLAALGLNKQLDLQGVLTRAGRSLAAAQGWHDQRRMVQLAFVVVLFGAAIFTAIWAWRHARHRSRGVRISLAGFCLLLCFVVIRAASFHHAEEFLHVGFAGSWFNSLLELGGIVLVAIGARSSVQEIRLKSALNQAPKT